MCRKLACMILILRFPAENEDGGLGLFYFIRFLKLVPEKWESKYVQIPATFRILQLHPRYGAFTIIPAMMVVGSQLYQP